MKPTASRPGSLPPTERGSDWLHLSSLGQTPLRNEEASHRAAPSTAAPTLTLGQPPDSGLTAGVDLGLGVADTGELPRLPGYEVLAELGRGGMGVVYQARQLALNRMVALKMVLSGSTAGPEERRRFRAEAEAVAQLQHPNIVQIHEVGEFEGRPFFSMEFCAEGGLDRHLRGQPQEPAAAARLARTLAQAVAAAHARGIIHRDLKPANVLLASPGLRAGPERESADPVPKITDFGLAKWLNNDAAKVNGRHGAVEPTRTGAVLGTPSYMAPEQAAGKSREVGPLADVYSLGAVLYELLTGRPPFRGLTTLDTVMQVLTTEPLPPRRLQPGLPIDLQNICLKALDKDPRRRYASAQDLANDLDRFLNGEPVQARPLSTLARGWRWARRRPAAAGLLAVSLAALLLLVGGGLWYQQQLRTALAAAEQEKLRANRHFREAKAAVDDSFTLISQNRLLKEPGFEGLRRDMLATARDYYQKFAATYRDDPTVGLELAQTQWRLGTILALTDGPTAAIPVLKQASQNFAAWAQTTTNPAAVEGQARALAALADELEKAGDLTGALSSLEQARDLVAPWRPEDAPARHDLQAEIHLELFHLRHKTGQNQQARKLMDTALERYGPVATAEGAPLDRRLRLAGLRDGLALLLLRTGQFEEGEKLMLESMAEVKPLLSPGQTELSEIEVLTRMAEQANVLGVLFFMRRNYTAAQPHLEACEKYYSQVLVKNPLLRSMRSRQASALLNLGRLAGQRGADSAGTYFQQAVEQFAGLAREVPAHVEYTLDWADALQERANHHLQRKNLDASQADLESAITLLEKLLKDHPQLRQQTDVKSKLFRQHRQLALFLTQWRQDAARAEEHYRRTLAVTRELAAQDSRRAVQREVASSLHDLAEFYRGQQRSTEARAAFTECRELQERLLKEGPDDIPLVIELAWNYGLTGHLHADAKEYEAALPWYAKVIDLLKPKYQVVIARIGKPHPAAQPLLADAYQWQATTLDRLGRQEEAESAWQEAIALASGSHKPLKKLLRLDARLTASSAKELLAEATRLAESAPKNGAVQKLAAQLFSQAVPLASEPEEMLQWRDQAFRFLEAARAAGIFKAPAERIALAQGKEWKALRDDTRFASFLQAITSSQ